MLTPRFRVEQTDENIILHIHAPYTDVNESEIHVDRNQVCFFASPYYLRLNLPGQVAEDEKSKGHFDVGSGDYVVTLTKCNKGQHFEDLDMVNTLLKAPSGKNLTKIEVLGEETDHQDLLDFDWHIDQEISEEVPEDIIGLLPKYGFANRKSGLLKPLEADLPELMDLKYPDSTPASEREKLQEDWENEHFSQEHFLADWAEEDELIKPLLEEDLHCVPEISDSEFSAEEQERLIRLPKLDIIALTAAEQKTALLSLAEILFCWAHEQISTQGDTGPESARSVRRLSSTFSWLRSFTSVQKLTLSCMRRSLCVPLYRNWKLALAAFEKTQKILKRGRVIIIKSLLNLIANFAECESYHIHSQLYLEPYCVWIQSVSEETFSKLADSIEKHIPNKSDVGWDLEELEIAGQMTLEEEHDVMESLTNQLKASLHVRTNVEDSDDSDDSECESDSSESDSQSSEDDEEPSSTSTEDKTDK
ncbi:protein SHQ1 homolog [Neocloeon triangulifer]|uniref:protein SHQ1 homolog n=1 Tax=Neocloeon triangulifer TaxID=2078957 RepID=UPI00286F5A9D|nr:protein SHQ1 homolog [Neocloeon triangulifer]